MSYNSPKPMRNKATCTSHPAIVALFIALVVPGMTLAAPGPATIDTSALYIEGRLIIKLKEEIRADERVAIEVDLSARVARQFQRSGAELWELSDLSVEEAMNKVRNHPRVEYAEPDFIAFEIGTPNDRHYPLQWGLSNIGQTGGANDADIDAPEAWDLETGGDEIIAVLDSGVDYTHPDLAPNMWTNTGEIPNNGLDDDGNGYVDDVHCYDFINNDGDPMDDRFHGTHVAGIAAAAGNNSIGVAGVNWSAKIMALKFLGSNGFGSYSDAISAIEYATMMGVRLSNHSWGGYGFSQLLLDEITAARTAGHLLIAGAGNDGTDNDSTPFYPASFNLNNIISVAATDHNDLKPAFSNFGHNSVDLGAPGVDVFSTFLPFADFDTSQYVCSDTDGDGYGYCTGTSMSTPFVAGVAALLWTAQPQLAYQEIRNLILNTVDPVPALKGVTETGGRLNAERAVAAASPGGVWSDNVNGTLVTGQAFDFAMGYHFTPLVNGKVTELGGLFEGTKTVKLFEKVTGTLLASAPVTASNTWSYTPIAPVSVQAGTTYSVVAYLAGSGASYRSGVDTFPQQYGPVRIEGSAAVSTNGNPNARPTNTITWFMYGQADIKFEEDTGSASDHPWQDNANGLLVTDLAWDYAMGYHFTPLVNGTVDELGGFFNGAKTVKLFDKATGALLASATVNAANTWGYAPIAPVPVQAGKAYTVAVYLAGSGGSHRSGVATFPQTYGDIRINGSTVISTSGNPNARPTNTITWWMYGQADIGFSP